MADYLLVIDMQTDYVAEGKAYDHKALLAAINDKIASYSNDRVIYVVNRFFWELNGQEKQFADGLTVVSQRIFEKHRTSCFTNHALKTFLKNSGAKSLDFTGVDGNGCVKGSVLAAAREGYQMTVDLSCVGVMNQKKFQKTLRTWKKQGIHIEGSMNQ